jgi:SAM-dependent methyltransferase
MLISESLHKEILRRLEPSNWSSILEFLLSSDGLPVDKERLKTYILDNRSTYWRLLLRQPPKGNILHLGTNDWGKTAIDLVNSINPVRSVESTGNKSGQSSVSKTLDVSNEVNKITYLDFDNNNWRMKLVQLRLKEAGINNSEFILWDKEKALPFTNDTFDLVVSNGFFDEDEILSDKYQFTRRITAEIYSLLKEGGGLFLSAENKWYQRGYNSYRELLLKAGFKDLRFWSAIPDYRSFNYIIPLDNHSVLGYWVSQVDSQNFINKIRSIGLYLCLNMGILKYVVPNFCITAYK